MTEGDLATIAACRPALADDFATVEEGLATSSPAAVELFVTRSGATSIRIDGRTVHSAVDPLREAERLVATAVAREPDADGWVIFGCGLSYVSEAIRRHADGDVIVVRPDREPLAPALAHRDAAWWCRFGPDRIVPSDHPDALAVAASALGMRRPRLIVLQAIARSFPESFARFERAVTALRERGSINRNTLRRFGRLWVRNTIRNIPRTADVAGIDGWEGRAQGVPIVVCGAGPTLDDSLDTVRRLADRCLVIAVDTALPVLRRIGVRADIAVVADPQYWNTRHLDNAADSATVLIAESATHPRIFRLWRGPVRLSASLFPLGSFVDARVGRTMRLGAGGSVATSAWDLARYLGASSILLAGVDLGFPRRETHCRGSFFEERIIARAHRLAPAEQGLARYLHGAGATLVPATPEGSVLSDRRMALYRSWFEQQIARRGVPTCVLAAGGSRIPGVDVCSEAQPAASNAARPENAVTAVREWLAAEARARTAFGGQRADGTGAPRESAGTTLRALEARLGEIEAIAARGHAVAEEERERAHPDLARLDAVDAELVAVHDRELAGFILDEAAAEITGERPQTAAAACDQARALYRAVMDACGWQRRLVATIRAAALKNGTGDVDTVGTEHDQ